ncbi:MAG: branched-chain amino acid ABC transporter permease [Acidimicrobiales bacterium]
MIAYIVNVATIGAITAILCLGVNVSWGWVGQLDLAYYAYVAVGAYLAIVLELPHSVSQAGLQHSYVLGLHWPFIPSIIVAALLGGVLALIVGFIALRRLRGDYVAIITIIFAIMLTAVLSQDSSLFGGQIGVYGVSSPLNSALHLNPTNYSYFYLGLCIVALIVVYGILEVLYRSPFGRSLRAVREDSTAASAFGRNVFSLRLRAYVLGGVIGAFGGALFGNQIGAWNPASWNLIEVVLLMSGVLVGGRGNSRGVILGSVIVLSIVPEVTRLVPVLSGNADIGPAIAELIAALLIIVIMRWRAAGIMPEPKTVTKERRTVIDDGKLGGGTTVSPAMSGRGPDA